LAIRAIIWSTISSLMEVFVTGLIFDLIGLTRDWSSFGIRLNHDLSKLNSKIHDMYIEASQDKACYLE